MTAAEQGMLLQALGRIGADPNTSPPGGAAPLLARGPGGLQVAALIVAVTPRSSHSRRARARASASRWTRSWLFERPREFLLGLDRIAFLCPAQVDEEAGDDRNRDDATDQFEGSAGVLSGVPD